MSGIMDEPIEYELWIEYDDATHNGVTVGKPARKLLSTYDLDDARTLRRQGQEAEQMSRRMSAEWGQPHFDATYTVVEVRTIRTTMEES